MMVDRFDSFAHVAADVLLVWLLVMACVLITYAVWAIVREDRRP